MVEYWITNVKIENNKIQEARALINTIEGLTNPVKYTKNEIVKSIEKTTDDWYTATFEGKEGVKNIWKKGSPLHVVTIDGEKFIRTDRNDIKKDNLDNLPKIK